MSYYFTVTQTVLLTGSHLAYPVQVYVSTSGPNVSVARKCLIQLLMCYACRMWANTIQAVRGIPYFLKHVYIYLIFNYDNVLFHVIIIFSFM